MITLSKRTIKDARHFGGIKPTCYKHLSRDKAFEYVTPLIVDVPVPPDMAQELLLDTPEAVQHAMAVKPGQIIAQGDVLLESKNRLTAPIRASLSGRFIGVTKVVAMYAKLTPCFAIRIERDAGPGTQEKQGTLEDYAISITETLDKLAEINQENARQKILGGGIFGMGGAGFSSFQKIISAKNVQTIIINIVECEPYITIDDVSVRTRPQALVMGALVLARVIDCHSASLQIIFAFEDNTYKAQSIIHETLEEFIKSSLGHNALLVSLPRKVSLEVASIPARYPSGGERQLIRTLLETELSIDQRPKDAGILVFNANTTQAIYDSVIDDRPLTKRGFTLSGAAVVRPVNVQAPIGTSIATILEQHAVEDNKIREIRVGGSFMGANLLTEFPQLGYTSATEDKQNNKDFWKKLSQQLVLTASTNALLFLGAHEIRSDKEQACIRCGECEPACPANLLPQELHWASREKKYAYATNLNLSACIECGACSYVCPSNIDLVSDYRNAKQAIRLIEQKTAQAALAKARFDAKTLRLKADEKKRATRKAQLTQPHFSALPIPQVPPLKSQGKRPALLSEAARLTESASVSDRNSIDRSADLSDSAASRLKVRDAENRSPTESGKSVLAKIAETQDRYQSSPEAKHAPRSDAGKKSDPAMAGLKKRIQALEARIAKAQDTGSDTTALEKGLAQLLARYEN